MFDFEEKHYNIPENWEPKYAQQQSTMGDFCGDPTFFYRRIIGWITPDGFVSPDKLPDEYKPKKPVEKEIPVFDPDTKEFLGTVEVPVKEEKMFLGAPFSLFVELRTIARKRGISLSDFLRELIYQENTKITKCNECGTIDCKSLRCLEMKMKDKKGSV